MKLLWRIFELLSAIFAAICLIISLIYGLQERWLDEIRFNQLAILSAISFGISHYNRRSVTKARNNE